MNYQEELYQSAISQELIDLNFAFLDGYVVVESSLTSKAVEVAR